VRQREREIERGGSGTERDLLEDVNDGLAGERRGERRQRAHGQGRRKRGNSQSQIWFPPILSHCSWDWFGADSTSTQPSQPQSYRDSVVSAPSW